MSKFKAEFEKLEVLGRGGFGVVYKVRHRLLECMYAVKAVVLPDDSARAESVLREVRTLARMQHPNIVRFYACWVEDGLPDDTMDIPRHLDGSTAASKMSCVIFESAENVEPSMGLHMPTMTETEMDVTATMTATEGPARKLAGNWKVLYMQMELCLGTIGPYLTYDYDLPVRMALFGQLLRGVGYLHQNGIVHNDLKPSNLLMHQQHLKIADFGLITDSTLPAAFRGGTPLYVPPETARGTASDIFSLGIIFVEFLCSPLKDRERVLKLVRCREIPVSEFPVLAPYESLILAMVSYDPAQRPDVTQLQQMLKAIETPHTPSEPEGVMSGDCEHSIRSGSSAQNSKRSVSQTNNSSNMIASSGMSAGHASASTLSAAETRTGTGSDERASSSNFSMPSTVPEGSGGFSQSKLIADLEAQLEQLRSENVIYAAQAAQAADARDELQKQHAKLVDQHKIHATQQAEMKAQMDALQNSHTRELSAEGGNSVSKTRTKDELLQMVEFVPDPAAIVDLKGQVLCCNGEMKDELGWPSEELEGQNISVLLPDILNPNQALQNLLASSSATRKASLRSLSRSGTKKKSVVVCKKPKGIEDVLVVIIH